MSTVAAERIQIATGNHYAPVVVCEQISIALLGLGQVGTAVAAAAREADRRQRLAFTITGALVRDSARPRTAAAVNDVPVTTSPEVLLNGRPHVVVEVLGGLEPARTLVLDALERRIPVVTANKALLAAHGDELFRAAAGAGVPLRYEATVIAGVPFLGTFARRPLVSSITSLTGIVNGTSNFILSLMANERTGYADALRAAQVRGLAEPEPSRDVRGADAADKLCILLRQFAHVSVRPADIETAGIDSVDAQDLRHAAAFGGAIKPIVQAAWGGSAVTAFVGAAFVPASHPLANVHGSNNGIVLAGGPSGDLFYSGAGAGPAITAATMLDDVAEAVEDVRRARVPARQPSRPAFPEPPQTGWLVRLTAPRLPGAIEVADLLSAHGVWAQRTSENCRDTGHDARWLLTYPCHRARIERALRTLSSASGCETACLRALEASQ